MSSYEFVQNSFPAFESEVGTERQSTTRAGELTRRQTLGVLGTVGALAGVGWLGYTEKQLSDWAREGYTLTAENKGSASHLALCLRHAREGVKDPACFQSGMAMAQQQENPAAMKTFALMAQKTFQDDPEWHADIADGYLQQSAFVSKPSVLRERKFLNNALARNLPKGLVQDDNPALEVAGDALERPLYFFASDLPEDIQGGLEYALRSVKIFMKNMENNQFDSKNYQWAQSGITRITSAVRRLGLPSAAVADFTAAVESISFDPVFQESVRPDLMALRGEAK